MLEESNFEDQLNSKMDEDAKYNPEKETPNEPDEQHAQKDKITAYELLNRKIESLRRIVAEYANESIKLTNMADDSITAPAKKTQAAKVALLRETINGALSQFGNTEVI